MPFHRTRDDRYYDWDREDHIEDRGRGRDRRYSSQSPDRDPRDRTSSPDFGGPPSREIILDGLPTDITEADIRRGLEQDYGVQELEDVRVIRDRMTREPRGFGFLRFLNVDAAADFMTKNHPKVYFYPAARRSVDQQSVKVYVAYSRERDAPRDRSGKEGDWSCKACGTANFQRRVACYNCHAPRPESSAAVMGRGTQFSNNGDNDAGSESAPSQFLLVRGLKSGVSEEVFAKGMAKLYKGAEAKNPGNPDKKQPKIVSTTSTVNMGAREGSIKRVLIVRDKHSDESWRFGFAEFHTIDDARDALTKFNASGKFSISSEPVMVSYIHSGVFIPVMGPAAEEHTITATSNPSLKLAYWDENAYVSELVVSDEPPGGRSRSATPTPADAKPPEAGADAAMNPAADKKKRKADAERASDKKKAMQMPSHLQFWSDRHAELHGEKKRRPGTDDPATTSSSSPVKPALGGFAARQSYADMQRRCCYLCMRQFKTRAGVRRHEQISDMHHTAMRDRDALARANAKLTKHNIPPRLVAPPRSADANEYRDRARERRRAYNQPKKPVSIPMGAKAATSSPSKEEEKAAPPVQSKGASLLGKMGYVAGQGLGASGEGMTAPIAMDVYAAGVGLGASGGKLGDAVEEASRSTRGDYKEFVEKAKDKAKERYESMQ